MQHFVGRGAPTAHHAKTFEGVARFMLLLRLFGPACWIAFFADSTLGLCLAYSLLVLGEEHIIIVGDG